MLAYILTMALNLIKSIQKNYRAAMITISIDKAFKKLSKTCAKASEAIKVKIESQNETRKLNRERRNNKKFLEGYKDEIPLARASLKGISIEQAAKEIKEVNNE